LTLKMERMRKDMQLEFSVTMEVEDNNGKLCILIKLIKTEQREWTLNSVSTSTDHST
jgi:hypothetical protein